MEYKDGLILEIIEDCRCNSCYASNPVIHKGFYIVVKLDNDNEYGLTITLQKLDEKMNHVIDAPYEQVTDNGGLSLPNINGKVKSVKLLKRTYI